MLARLLSVFALLFAFVSPAFAEVKIATVDYQRALDNVAEGASARAKLEKMYADKKAAVEKLKTNVQTLQAEVDRQSVILTDAAMQQKQKDLQTAYAQYQQAAQQAEGEMQQAYTGAMETLIEKMKKLTQTIAAEKGYTLVVEVNEGGVVYASPTIDITDELIKRYNAANPAPAAPAPAPKK